MRRFAREIIDSLAAEPERWKVDRYRLWRDDGVRLWIANGRSCQDLEKFPRPLGFWEKRHIWRAYQTWLSNRSLEELLKWPHKTPNDWLRGWKKGPRNAVGLRISKSTRKVNQ